MPLADVQIVGDLADRQRGIAVMRRNVADRLLHIPALADKLDPERGQPIAVRFGSSGVQPVDRLLPFVKGRGLHKIIEDAEPQRALYPGELRLRRMDDHRAGKSLCAEPLNHR